MQRAYGYVDVYHLVRVTGVLTRRQWLTLCQLRARPHCARFSDRGAKGRQKGSQRVTAEEALGGGKGSREGLKTGHLVFMCIMGDLQAGFFREFTKSSELCLTLDVLMDV